MVNLLSLTLVSEVLWEGCGSQGQTVNRDAKEKDIIIKTRTLIHVPRHNAA